MSQPLSVEAVRLALGMNQLRAETASRNITQASTPGAKAMRVDRTGAQSALDAAAAGDASSTDMEAAITRLGTSLHSGGGAIEIDAEVAEMVAASTNYQTLTEALGRHFGLMRLAISGKS